MQVKIRTQRTPRKLKKLLKKYGDYKKPITINIPNAKISYDWNDDFKIKISAVPFPAGIQMINADGIYLIDTGAI